MGQTAAQLAGLLAFGIAVGARVRSSPDGVPRFFWTYVIIGALASLTSPFFGLLAAAAVLVTAQIRDGAYGLMTGLVVLLGIATFVGGLFAPEIALITTLAGLPVVAVAGLILHRVSLVPDVAAESQGATI